MSESPEKSAAGPKRDWSPRDAADLYRVDSWGDGFFHVNEAGHVAVHPFDGKDLSIDITEVVSEVRRRGLHFPAVLRFQDVLRARVERLHRAFKEAISEYGYKGNYRPVYPIKVNQLHEVVEEVLEAGLPFGLGLECGSRAELVATLAHLESDETPLICNGVKDRSMLNLVLSAQELGKHVIPVMEKYSEFGELMQLANERGQGGQFGVRLRLRTSGAGKWVDSGGYQSKFGVSLPELLELVEELKAGDCVQRLVLLHFHLGSQITNITQLKQAARELAQTYAELVLSGLSIRYIDVGGGLGVNYTGAFEDGSINYSLQEYANAVVSVICDVCNDRGVPHPTLMSESGRAMAAHHSVLVVETLGAFRKDRAGDDPQIPGDAHRVLRQFGELLDWLRQEQQDAMDVNALVEAYHDVIALHEEAHTLFTMGYLPLEQNALVERLYWSSCANILRCLKQAGNEPMPPEFDKLQELMVDQYLVDFSVFQSLLDHWAIQQPFPIVPLDRLDERPTRRAILVDLTCDSDGRVTEYVSANDDRKFLELHELDPGEHYYLGIFLTGAYQDIMGDDHNLLGRVSEAHIYADAEEKGNFWIEKLIPGARVGDMLAKVQYFTEDLQRRMQKIVKQKIESGAIRPSRGIEVLEEYKDMFAQETYLINDRANEGEAR